ncbi:MAG TPA: methylmalonyl-CoA mutase [Halieaceae bacterium]|jgi:methylmalonyl-CoA mutase C-terminal domain/subunit|uniref:cobalamin B12-binding domain-containing protein n=1 Tax=Haliea TaxID=475794 RepID=UPI000C69ADA1|nr:cobalamin B12-binding domain-containing protein [Haliea sp.]HAN67741.1 methylmalonyl-CoA mutase [Halieaceae bacterium]MAD64314.1 methylmalonyl-CoA mutase [Haliea sp.]MAY93271.1 methylmalonyl-CoA mutase [Haliea sp.]MBK39944.1 methylmalonyl-CoA mutase [Haliea sp.]MBP71161.1 methylmalonyl-CoA mutase [Haliea sp.]|tara:strand:+ start:26961 stop:27386 length:426 start_codon:yes stop_codon:yes gene_type:complete
MTNAQQRPLRILLAKLGMDTHTVGITIIAHALREAGMEVIFTGLKQTPEMVAAAAIQEDVDVVGISTLSAGHTRNLPKLARLLREAGAGDKLLLAGGVIPEEDRPLLEEAGVDRTFTMGSDTRDIVAYLNEWWAQQLAADA